MKYFINSTADYHQHELNSLGWELTVCNALEPENSPCRKILLSDRSFGYHLHHFLKGIFSFDDVHHVLEIGGGMGYLMRDFLLLNPNIRAKMMDISPFLLNKQKESLQSFPAEFELADIMAVPPVSLRGFDFAVMNENLGDLPTLVVAGNNEVDSDFVSADRTDQLEYFNKRYSLELESNSESINIGALEVVEKLCLAEIKYIYLGEHSCEATVPDNMKSYLSFPSSGSPERIPLKGHLEFTIKFSCLQKIAEMLNYRTRRGPFADFLPFNLSDKVKTALRLETPLSDEQEIIRQFVHDLYKYEYLILIKGDES